eukprot:3400871-Heterocapsa_arctica.AAC.1
MLCRASASSERFSAEPESKRPKTTPASQGVSIEAIATLLQAQLAPVSALLESQQNTQQTTITKHNNTIR